MDRAPVILNPGGEQGLEPLAHAGVEAADEFAMSIAPCEGAARQGEALDERSWWNDDAADLQFVDDGAHDRLALFGPDRGRGAGSDRDAVVGLPDRAQFEVENDLARMLPSRLVAAGVEIEDPRLDPELLGDDVDEPDPEGAR